MTPLQRLHQQGQSIWLDYIHRELLVSGQLQKLIEQGVRGLTSNPTIFDKAISSSDYYDTVIGEFLEKNADASISTLYEYLAITDIQMAADAMRPVYDASGGGDGFVSLEVSPHLAYDTNGTIDEAQRLWRQVDRPNLMVKVPATTEGIPAIETLIGMGINVNVTLMFSLAHYEAVAQAYIRGLRKCQTPAKVASVASFFVSRVDTTVDKALEEIDSKEALSLRGKIAIANSKMAYKRFIEIFRGEDFANLTKNGARVQRPLWASTGTKNPAYSDVLYIEELIGSDTVNTLPPASLDAFLDHGEVAVKLRADCSEEQRQLAQLATLGIDLNAVTEKLQKDGVDAFAQSFDQLMSSLQQKRDKIDKELIDAVQ